MDNFEFNQLLLAIILLFNIVVLIIESDFKNIVMCTEGNTLEEFICVISNMYVWMFIVNIIYIIFVTCKIINYIILYQRRYVRQYDTNDVPPV